MGSESEEDARSSSVDEEIEAQNSAGEPDDRPKKRHATLYDAVAGKVLDHEGSERKDRSYPIIKHSTKDTPLGPDEVLFRRRGAPERYAEHDIYLSHHRDLPRGGRGVLPDSDLLKAVHTYSSQFYGAQRRLHRHQGYRDVDGRSMDETALLAFGVLLEEAGREVLGRRGDLVFTEANVSDGDEVAGQSSSPQVAVGRKEVGSRVNPSKKRRLSASID